MDIIANLQTARHAAAYVVDGLLYFGTGYTGVDCHALASFASVGLYMGTNALLATQTLQNNVVTPTKTVIKNLQELRLKETCQNIQSQILERLSTTEFAEYFENSDYKEKGSDPKTVASIKRILNSIKNIEDSLVPIESFDLNAPLTDELLKRCGEILNRIGPLEQSIRDLSHAINDAEAYLQPLVGSLSTHLYKSIDHLGDLGQKTLQTFEEKKPRVQELLGTQNIQGIQYVGRAIVISPYILQEMTELLKGEEKASQKKIKKKELAKYDTKFSNLMQPVADKNIQDEVRYYTTLTSTLFTLLKDTQNIYQNYKSLSQELYKQGQENLDKIQNEILPQLQSELEGIEEQMGLPQGFLVTTFNENATAQLQFIKEQLDIAKNATISKLIHKNYILPLTDKIVNFYKNFTSLLPKLIAKFDSSFAEKQQQKSAESIQQEDINQIKAVVKKINSNPTMSHLDKLKALQEVLPRFNQLYDNLLPEISSSVKNNEVLAKYIDILYQTLKYPEEAYKEFNKATVQKDITKAIDDEHMQPLRLQRFKEYQIETEKLKRVQEKAQEFFSNASQLGKKISQSSGIIAFLSFSTNLLEDKKKLREDYIFLQPYFLARYPHLDVKICAYLTDDNEATFPIEEINKTQPIIEMEIEHEISQQKFNQQTFKKRYPTIELPTDLDKDSQKELKKRLQNIETLLLKAHGNDFYYQDLFGRIHELKLSEKVSLALDETILKLNRLLKPELLKELGIGLTDGQKPSDILKNYQPNKEMQSEAAKTYQKAINSLFKLKSCLLALERVDDIEKDPNWGFSSNIETIVGGAIGLVTDEDPKKIKYLLGTLFPILTDGLGTVWEVQALADDPILKDVLESLKSDLASLKDLQFISGLMGGVTSEPVSTPTTELAPTIEGSEPVQTPESSDSSSTIEEEKATSTIEKAQKMSETISDLLKFIESLVTISDEKFEEIKSDIIQMHQMFQDELLDTESKMGMKPGALFEEFSINQKISVGFEFALKKLYQLKGKEISLGDILLLYPDEHTYQEEQPRLSPSTTNTRLLLNGIDEKISDRTEIKINRMLDAAVRIDLAQKYEKKLGPSYPAFEAWISKKMKAYFKEQQTVRTCLDFRGQVSEILTSIALAIPPEIETLLKNHPAILEHMATISGLQQSFQLELNKNVEDSPKDQNNVFIVQSQLWMQDNITNVFEILNQQNETMDQIEKDLARHIQHVQKEENALIKLTAAYNELNHIESKLKSNDPRLEVIQDLKKLFENLSSASPKLTYTQVLVKVRASIDKVENISLLNNSKESWFQKAWQIFKNIFQPEEQKLKERFSHFKDKLHSQKASISSGSETKSETTESTSRPVRH